MVENDAQALEQAMEQARQLFSTETMRRFTSTTSAAPVADLESMGILPMDQRGPIPYTAGTYEVAENSVRVEWEREVRKFWGYLS